MPHPQRDQGMDGRPGEWLDLESVEAPLGRGRGVRCASLRSGSRRTCVSPPSVGLGPLWDRGKGLRRVTPQEWQMGQPQRETGGAT